MDGNKHVQRSSSSLVIKETSVRSTVSCHCMSSRMTQIKKKKKSCQALEDIGEQELSYSTGRNKTGITALENSLKS